MFVAAEQFAQLLPVQSQARFGANDVRSAPEHRSRRETDRPPPFAPSTEQRYFDYIARTTSLVTENSRPEYNQTWSRRSSAVRGDAGAAHHEDRARPPPRRAENAIRRLLDLDHRSHIDQVDRALAALGKRLEVRVLEPA
jgi:hypothetical protein